MEFCLRRNTSYYDVQAKHDNIIIDFGLMNNDEIIEMRNRLYDELTYENNDDEILKLKEENAELKNKVKQLRGQRDLEMKLKREALTAIKKAKGE